MEWPTGPSPPPLPPPPPLTPRRLSLDQDCCDFNQLPREGGVCLQMQPWGKLRPPGALGKQQARELSQKPSPGKAPKSSHQGTCQGSLSIAGTDLSCAKQPLTRTEQNFHAFKAAGGPKRGGGGRRGGVQGGLEPGARSPDVVNEPTRSRFRTGRTRASTAA